MVGQPYPTLNKFSQLIPNWV